ncbi:MAG: DUF2520 domain-containing protein [candidate division WOR-3 bacterium]
MKIGLIGCGRVGLTFAYFLRKKDILYGVFDKNKNALKRAVQILQIKRNPEYVDLIRNSNVLLFATPDDELINAYNKAERYITETKHLFHFSGVLPAEIFPKKKKIYRASLHPFASFPKVVIPPRRNRYILFVQGDKESIKVAHAIFPKKNFKMRKIDKRQKPLYHLLGVFSSNFVVSLSEAIHILLKKLRWKDTEFEEVVLPMIFDSFNNVKKYGVKMGLTGPLIRGDLKTIEKHLETLKKDQELSYIYRALSYLIIKYAPAKTQKRLKEILNIN